MVAEQLFKQLEGILLILCCAIMVFQTERPHKVVGHTRHLLYGRGCRAYREVTVELARIGIEDGATVAFGHLQGIGRLAHSRRADYYLQCLCHA